MDIKHVLSCNPLQPAYTTVAASTSPADPVLRRGSSHDGGLVEIGHDGDGFRLRQRIPPPHLAHRALRPGRRHRDVRRVAGLHGGRRLQASRPVAVRRLGHGPGASSGTRRCTGSRSSTTGGSSPWAARSSSTRPSRCATSATTRPMPSPAGPGGVCRPSRSGRRWPSTRVPDREFPRPVGAASSPRGRRHVVVRQRVAVDIELLQPVPGVPPRARARWASTTASSW